MSGNSAKVREKSGGKGPKSGKGQGICVVTEISLWQLNKISYLYFVRTVFHFSYVTFTENSD